MTGKKLELAKLALNQLSIKERAELLRDYQPAEKTEQPTRSGLRVVQRETAADMLNRSLRYVDYICRRGFVRKITPPGNRRAIGLSLADLEKFIAMSTPEAKVCP